MHPCYIVAIILGVIAIITWSIIKVSPDWPEWAENLVFACFGVSAIGAAISSCILPQFINVH